MVEAEAQVDDCWMDWIVSADEMRRYEGVGEAILYRRFGPR